MIFSDVQGNFPKPNFFISIGISFATPDKSKSRESKKGFSYLYLGPPLAAKGFEK